MKKLSFLTLILFASFLKAAEQPDHQIVLRTIKFGDLLSIQYDEKPMTDLIKQGMTYAYEHRPSLPRPDVGALMTKVGPALATLMRHVGPYLSQADLLLNLFQFTMQDQNEFFVNAIVPLKHFIMSGILFNPEHYEYFHVFVNEFCKAVDPVYLQYLEEQGIMRILNMLGNAKGGSKLMSSSSIPLHVGGIMRSILASTSIPLAKTDDPLNLLSAEPAPSMQYKNLHELFIDKVRKGDLETVRDTIMRYPTIVNLKDVQTIERVNPSTSNREIVVLERTPLFAAVVGCLDGVDNSAVFECLLEHGANIDSVLQSKRASVADFIALNIQKGHPQSVRLKQLQQIIMQRKAFLAAMNLQGQPAAAGSIEPAAFDFRASADEIALLTKYIEQAQVGDDEKAIRVISQCPRLLFKKDENGMTFLHKAALSMLVRLYLDMRKTRTCDELRGMLSVRQNGAQEAPLPCFLRLLNVQEEKIVAKKEAITAAENDQQVKKQLEGELALLKPISQVASNIMAYMLMAGIAADAKDVSGNTAQDYILAIERICLLVAQQKYKEALENAGFHIQGLQGHDLEEQLKIAAQNGIVMKPLPGLLQANKLILQIDGNARALTKQEQEKILKGIEQENKQRQDIARKK